MVTIEHAQMTDAEAYYAIIDDARSFQQEQGFVQWTEEYPNLDTVKQDIQCAKGYVAQVDGKIAGYMCIDFDGEPAYAHIQGAWRTEEPYAVVHRMALHREFRGIGLADAVFQRIAELCGAKGVYSIRVDTDFPNRRMQHILKKNHFTRCGVIVFQGSDKLAYDKSLR